MGFSFMASTVEEKNKVSQVRKEQLELVKELFAQAKRVNSSTPQKQICNLLSNTSNYISKNKYFVSEVKQLHVHLSHCLECIYNNEVWAFKELSSFLSKNTSFA